MAIAHFHIELFHNTIKNNNNTLNNSRDIQKLRKDNTTLHWIPNAISSNFINNTLYSNNLNLQENGISFKII